MQTNDQTAGRESGSASATLLAGQREQAWGYVIRVMAGYPDRNDKAVIVQNAMAELGPVPNSMGDAVRQWPANAPADLPRTGDAEHPKTLPIEAQRE